MPDLSTIANFGVAGFAIYIMWKMYDSNTREREKHLVISQQEREKFMTQINDVTKEHNLLQTEVRDKIIDQLNKNTAAFEKVLSKF